MPPLPFSMEADDDDFFDRPSRFRRARKQLTLVCAVVVLAAIAGGIALGVILSKRKNSDGQGTSSKSKAGSLGSDSVPPPSASSTMPPTVSTLAQATPGCVYVGSGDVLVFDATLPHWTGPAEVWTEVAVPKLNLSGVQFNKNNVNQSFVGSATDNPQREYVFQVGSAGTYFLTMVSSVQGPGEFNTLWVQFPYGSGLTYWSIATGMPEKGTDGTGWQVLYQNVGATVVGIFGLQTDLHTVSLNQSLTPGKQYRLLINGRSPQFTLFRILLARCTGAECSGTGAPWSLIKNATSSGYVTPCT